MRYSSYFGISLVFENFLLLLKEKQVSYYPNYFRKSIFCLLLPFRILISYVWFLLQTCGRGVKNNPLFNAKIHFLEDLTHAFRWRKFTSFLSFFLKRFCLRTRVFIFRCWASITFWFFDSQILNIFNFILILYFYNQESVIFTKFVELVKLFS